MRYILLVSFSVRPCVFYFRAGRSLRGTGPQADFERPGVSSLRPGVTTAQSGRVVRRTVGGAFRTTAVTTRERRCVVVARAEVGSVARRTGWE